MSTRLALTPIAPDAAASRPAAGIWSLDGDRLVSVESFDVGPAIVLVPTEQVLLTSAELPLPSLRRRAEALPFAIEDLIGAPLDSVHVALGAEVAAQRHVAGVVAHDRMQGWIDRLADAGLDRAAIVPDALALPLPAVGEWSVDIAAGRAMIRTADGAGCALPVAHLDAAWRAAGAPACTGYGDALPPAMGEASADMAAAPLAARLTAPALDLRQGVYARPRRTASPLVRRIALVAAAGLLAHGVIAAADTLALDHIATVHAAQARALAAAAAPGIASNGDLATIVADIAPPAGGGGSAFLPLLLRVTDALKPIGAGVAFRSLSFDAGANSLSIEIEAADMAGLQRVGQTLQASGLSAESGAASTDQGKAVGAFLIRGGR